MIDPKEFFDILQAHGVNFYAGVPDSLLKHFCAYAADHTTESNHVITANEGAGVALAVGHHLATNQLALVYMQNSGIGNAINPLVSLADPYVYGIPLLLLIGWRGEPGRKDEPQHIKQGKKTIELLQCLEIPHAILDSSDSGAQTILQKGCRVALERSCPYAFVVRDGTFQPYIPQKDYVTQYPLTREGALRIILSSLGEEDVVVATTGKTSREVFEYREVLQQGHEKDFLTVGSMGHASQIALGIALNKPKKDVYCLDGDGAVIMHMGSLAIIGSLSAKNFKHIIINNGAHDSVGGQPTAGFKVDFTAIAKACGYSRSLVAKSVEEIKESMKTLQSIEGPALLEVRVNKGARKDLGRPTTRPLENKIRFMEFLRR